MHKIYRGGGERIWRGRFFAGTSSITLLPKSHYGASGEYRGYPKSPAIRREPTLCQPTAPSGCQPPARQPSRGAQNVPKDDHAPLRRSGPVAEPKKTKCPARTRYPFPKKSINFVFFQVHIFQPWTTSRDSRCAHQRQVGKNISTR